MKGQGPQGLRLEHEAIVGEPMIWVEEEGRTKEEAVNKAISKLGCSLDEATVEVVQESGPKMFGLLGGRSVRVRVARQAGGQDRAGEQAKAVLQTILDKMQLPCTVNAEKRDGICYFDIAGSGAWSQLRNKEEVLDALQYLVYRIVNRGSKENVAVVVDSDHFRERRVEQLQVMALKSAALAKRTGRPTMISPMNARDRRVVHLALKEDDGVKTESQGEGLFKRVIISPKPGPRRLQS